MVTPAGSPAWVRTAGITDYGGATDKANYGSQGVINPRTDVGAAAFMRAADHLKSCALTAPFAEINFTCNDAAPAVPTINYCRLMPSGAIATAYEGDAAPAGFPSGARNGDGDVTFTFDASYLDAYGVSGALELQFAEATANETTAIVATARLPSVTTCRVYLWTSSTGLAALDKTATVTVA